MQLFAMLLHSVLLGVKPISRPIGMHGAGTRDSADAFVGNRFIEPQPVLFVSIRNCTFSDRVRLCTKVWTVLGRVPFVAQC